MIVEVSHQLLNFACADNYVDALFLAFHFSCKCNRIFLPCFQKSDLFPGPFSLEICL